MPRLQDNKRWEFLSAKREDERLLCSELGIPPLVAHVLCARGITDVEEARAFLSPSLERDWVDPLEIPGMRDAADRVEAALRNNERIAVFGDFDVDGMTSTCLLTQALREFGGEVHPYIPHRFGEGYGLSMEALGRVMDGCDPELIITVDNGIASGKEVAWLLDHGIDVVVTDHHEPGELVPRGVPVTDPKLQPNCRSRELAGVGVALKLVCELGRRLGKPDTWRSYTDLAAMGTISDMMLLQGENRSLVYEGIKRMRTSDRPGIVALAATAGVDLSSVCADDLPFSLIPRLNAAGRMGSTDVAFDLLISSDPAEATTLAGILEQTNNKRRAAEAELSSDALSRLKQTYGGESVIVLAGEGWHEGVKGIVASRVVNRYRVPAIIFTIVDGIARGSGRSVGTVDLFHAVEQCSDLLIRFGGHSGAVGVTCEVDKLDAFRERLQQIIDALPDEELIETGVAIQLDSLSVLNLGSISGIDMLQPFGQGNKRPLFGIRGLFMRNRERVGYEKEHLKFFATDGSTSLPAIMFHVPDIERAHSYDGLVDIVADAVNERWQERVTPKLMVSDIVYHDGRGTSLSGEDGDEQLQKALDAPCVHTGVSHCVVNDQLRERLGALAEDELTKRLKNEFVGASSLLPAQREALVRLDEGESTLCVMATGRGKSLIFHLHAARLAIRKNKASVFVYPLRALVSDQSFHLEETLGRLGVSVRTLTGETPVTQRQETYRGLEDGTVDIVLTTPEYLAIHKKDFASCGRIGFVVVDEAHHAGMASSGREAYASLSNVLGTLGHPVVLAVTATASTDAARRICSLLGIRDANVLVDRSVRDNLRLEDYRNVRERDMLLSSMVCGGQKTVVYVNSRAQAATLARNLRANVPELGHRIAFYHAGLSRELRLRVEQAFRDDRLCCIVCTSAFGEGVNLPGIRNVVLYHMPFGPTEFNQMSGRAGRDGKDARISLLYGKGDAFVNEGILRSSAPSREDLVTLYRVLRQEDARFSGTPYALNSAELLQNALRMNNNVRLDESAVEAGIAVFEELGFCTLEGFGSERTLRLEPSPAHVDLGESLRYTEGIHALQEFAEFRDWALGSLPGEMLSRINRPIAPGFGTTVDR